MKKVLSLVVSLVLFTFCGCTNEDGCVKVNGVCQELVSINENSIITSVKTKCHNPTSLMVNNEKVYVVCSGDYQYDSDYNYLNQKDSGIELYGSSDLSYINGINVSGNDDFGQISSSDLGTFVGSTMSGRIWELTGDSLKEIDKKTGAVLPYCVDNGCLFLEQNTGKIEVRYNNGEVKFLDLSEFGVEYPWYTSPQIVGSYLYLLNSSSGQFNKYDFQGNKIYSRNVGQQYPNAMIYNEGWFYILDSQNNTVDRVNEAGDYQDAYIDLGLDANPYAINVWNNHLIIACYNSGFVYGYDLTQNSLIQLNREIIDQPSAIAYDSVSIYLLASEYNSSGSEGSLYKFVW